MVGISKQSTKHGPLYLLIYIILYNNVNSFINVSAQMISILPLDPAVCIGDNVTFTCSFGTEANSRKLIKPMLSTELLMTSSSTQIDYVNGEITLFNVSGRHDHVAVCCVLYDDGDEICDMLTESSSILNVYPLPIEVQNLSCLVENYDRTLNCSWSYGTTYERFKEPEVTLQWKRMDSFWMHCPYLDIDNGFCVWEKSHTDFKFKKIKMKICLKQTCGKSVETQIIIDTSKIVKPDPVVEFSGSALNSTCIHVKWRSTDRKYPKRHTVNVSSRWKDNLAFHLNTTAITEKQTLTRTFCGLYPYTSYTFTVRTFPIGNQSGYHSDPKSVIVVTYTDKPASSPKVIQGGYHWRPRECEGNKKERRVCIFWKPLAEEEKNGIIQSLPFTVNTVQGNRRHFQSDFNHDQTYGCLDNVSCDVSFNFSIAARNINGTSEKVSTLYVPSAASGKSQPVFHVEADNMNKLYFNIQYTETMRARNFLIAWCHNHNGDCQTDSEVKWETFALQIEPVVVQLEANDNPQDFLYGVSVVSEHTSSGLAWQECVYAKHKEPSVAPSNVFIATGPMDNSLLVSWDKLDCKPDEPYFIQYNVMYMNLEDGIQKSQNTSRSGEARLLLKDLVEDQTYVIQVRGVTKEGQYGPRSPPMHGIPLHKSFRSRTIVGLSLGTFTAAVVLVVICYCIIWKVRKKAMYNIAKAKEITIPVLDNNNSNSNILNT